MLYAAPEPAGALVACIRALLERWPDYPRYGGEFSEIVPHATLAVTDEATHRETRADVERRLAPYLPAAFEIEFVSLLEEFEPERWRERERLPLGG